MAMRYHRVNGKRARGFQMRGITAVVLTFAVVAGTVLPAGASSIVVLGAAQAADPSVVTLGTAQADDPSVVKAVQAEPEAGDSPSVVTLGEPAVSNDKVAAIPSSHAPRGAPMVIRAGIVGGASVAPAPATATANTSKAAKDSTGGAVKSSNGSLRDAMAQAGQAPAVAQ
jgi:hypothetical protein